MSWLANLGREVAGEVKHYSSLFNYLFPPADSLVNASYDDELTPKVRYSLIVQVGRPGSGKTTSSLSIAALVEGMYEDRFRVRTVVSPMLPRALKLIPRDTEVGVFIIDDAPVAHPAYGGRKFVDALNIATYFMMRHLARRRAPGIKYMVVVFNTQRYWSLDTAFREASNVDIFKSSVKEPRERKYLKHFLGSELFDFLQRIHKEIFLRRNEEAMRFFVYYTTWAGRGIGEFTDPLARPTNLILDRSAREEMLERLFGLGEVYESRGLLLKVVESLGRLGVKWSRTREIINKIREDAGVRLDNSVAHDIWKRGYESRITA